MGWQSCSLPFTCTVLFLIRLWIWFCAWIFLSAFAHLIMIAQQCMVPVLSLFWESSLPRWYLNSHGICVYQLSVRVTSEIINKGKDLFWFTILKVSVHDWWSLRLQVHGSSIYHSKNIPWRRPTMPVAREREEETGVAIPTSGVWSQWSDCRPPDLTAWRFHRLSIAAQNED